MHLRKLLTHWNVHYYKCIHNQRINAGPTNSLMHHYYCLHLLTYISTVSIPRRPIKTNLITGAECVYTDAKY
jgi:hypothetical protein